MEHYLTEAEQLYKDRRYEEALAAYEQAIRLSMPDPDPRLYYGRAAVLERLAEQAYDMAKQSGYSEDKQEGAIANTEATPSTMSLSALADRCMSEINNYRHGEVSGDQYCLELFRRAMLEQDNAAWALVVERFHEYMMGSFRRHVKREAASRLDSPENYVARAFDRFWLAAVHNQQLEFTTLVGALSYLRNCLYADILDTLRANSRSNEVVLPEPRFPDESAVEEHQEEDQGLWETIQGMLTNERERRVAYLLFYCNLKPREIVRSSPQEYSSVQEIYRLRRNIMERLWRNSDQIRWRLTPS